MSPGGQAAESPKCGSVYLANTPFPIPFSFPTCVIDNMNENGLSAEDFDTREATFYTQTRMLRDLPWFFFILIIEFGI